MSLCVAYIELSGYQEKNDQGCVDFVAEVQSHHLTEDLHMRPQASIADRRNVGVCKDGCGEPTFNVTDQESGVTEPRCRPCYNAIIRQSLTHTQYGGIEVCIFCHISKGKVGDIIAANHTTWHIEDYYDRDIITQKPEWKDSHYRAGLKTLIANDLVETCESRGNVGFRVIENLWVPKPE